jgi:AcrR family transcriptional regulator
MTGPKEVSRQEDRKPGRPRDPSADRAILQATLKLLTDQGYAGMSVERVASEAGVGKTTIYRRYASKEELAAAAVGALRDEMGPPPDTGNTRTDIIEVIVQTQVALERGPGFAMIGALLVEERRNPRLFELFRERIMRPRRDDLIMVLRRGVDRGDLRADVDLEVVVHALVGSIFARRILGTPESRKRIEETVDTIWSGAASNPQS